MPELENVQRLLDEAKRAAEAGDLASAGALLQDAARIQEAELGPLHPDLANTANNLAIVAEMEGRLGDAESYYRRAVAIASASLPPDDPIVASSRKNLEDFCRQRGLPFDLPPVAPSVPSTEPRTDRVTHDQAAGKVKTPADAAVADVGTPARSSVPETQPAVPATTSVVGESSDAAASRRPLVAIAAIGLVIVVAAALLFTRPWTPRESSGPVPPTTAAAPPAAQPAPPPVTAPIEQAKPPTVASRNDKTVTASPRASGPSSGGVTLVASQLCRSLSVGNNWRCDPAGQSVTPGPIVLYTRVRSPRDAVVIHRWYQGDALRKSARLSILANTTDGYRTFSRQTVKSGENWRVEVRTTDGDLLYEQRVSVQ